MTEFFDLLTSCPIFAGVRRSELPEMMRCLGGKKVVVEKGGAVFLEGEPAQWVGIVLSGAIQIVRDDYYGNRSVLTLLAPGDLFGEVFACAEVETLPVSAFAVRDSAVLLLDCKRVLNTCSGECRFHHQLVRNLLCVVAQKNLLLNQKIQVMSHKTTREKLMAYLLEQAKTQGKSEFTIPFDRQSLADYLGVERSAMSAEISKLKKDGVLDSKGSWFKLLPNR